MKKYSQFTAAISGYELCFYYPDCNGVETLEGLYNWESKDCANRKLFEVKDRKEAINIAYPKKLLRQFV